jgi:hypothetical protein
MAMASRSSVRAFLAEQGGRRFGEIPLIKTSNSTADPRSVLASDVPDVLGTSSRTPGDVWKSAFWFFFGRRGRHQDA